MLAKLLGIRSEDRRVTLVAFLTLAAMLAGHAMLETARDALFLAKLPPQQLPIAYLAIAALALVASRINQAAAARFPGRWLLAGTLLAGGVTTAAFYPLLAAPSGLSLGALYVWTGMLATLVVVQYWILLGDALDVGQAKRLFSIIGSGGLVGATLGSGAASALLAIVPARALLLVSSGLFAIAATAALGFSARSEAEPARRRGAPAPSGSALRLLREDGYLRRLFWMVLIGAVLVTGVDYVFKAAVVAQAKSAGWEIGSFFARYYALLNAVSLLVQLVIAPRLLRTAGVNRTLLVLPALLLFASIGFVATLGLVPALILKGADGALRHSVYKTSSEILYLPLAKRVRERFKALSDTLGQRGGQALASLVILGASLVHAEARHIGIGLCVLAALWLVCLVGLEPHYLELFRKQLREGALDTEVDVPSLDLASFETLVGALSADDDAEVIAALEMFAVYGKTDLVPALILYHPSRGVVLRAFELFATTERHDVLRLTGRLLRHEDPEIRAAALRVIGSAQADEAVLREHLDDPSPAVRCTALVGLVRAGLCDDDEAKRELSEICDGPSPETRLALARALRHLDPARFAWVGLDLAVRKEPGLAVEVARSMALAPDPRYTEVLIELLVSREGRGDARTALVAIGPPALEALAAALADTHTSRHVRKHLPRTISRFGGPRSAELLMDALAVERDEAVVLKLLRGLGRLRAADSSLEIDRERMLEVARGTLERAISMLHWRLAIGRRRDLPGGATQASELLAACLEEKEAAALQRLFRALHVLEPTQQFRLIYDGLRSSDGKTRASSRELLSHVVAAPLRDGILAMVEDLPPTERLAAAALFWDPPSRKAFGSGPLAREAFEQAYLAMVREMLADASDALRSIASYHAAELGLDELCAELTEAGRSLEDAFGAVAESALEMLRLPPSLRGQMEPTGAT